MVRQASETLTPRQFILIYLLRYKFRWLIGFLFVTLTNLWQVSAPWVLRYGIEYLEIKLGGASTVRLPNWLWPRVASYSIHHFLILLGAITIAVAAIQGLFRYLMRNLLIGLSRQIEYEIRNDYLHHLQSLPMSFYQRFRTGDLMARATNDMEAVRTMLGPGIMYLMNTITLTLFSVVMMLSISPQVMLWSLLPMPFVAYIVQNQVKKINALFQKIQSHYSTITARVQENLSGIRVIKSYVQEGHEIAEFEGLNREYIRRNMKLVQVRATLWSTIDFLLGLTILSAVFFSGWQVVHHRLSIGGLVAFIAYLNMLAWPIIALGWVLNLWQEGMASCERIVAIMREQPEIQDGPQTRWDIQSVQGALQFNHLSFQYSGQEGPVLKDIHLSIPQGMTLAVVGHTGAGKSTLVNLIPRLHEVAPDSLKIDGHDIRHIPLQVLRQHIGFVTQETMLYSDTLAENLTFGANQVSAAELDRAIHIAQLHKDLDQFPDGLKSMVGERGLTLSGGQKQRVAIARAVLRDPRILILDDALSAVDTYTEEEILHQLKEVRRDRTTILVSHRISTVHDADWIIVLKDGQIIEQGRHDQLVQSKGTYYHLYQRQLLEQSLEEI